MKKIYAVGILLVLVICCGMSVNAENINTYNNIEAYRYDETNGYVKFNAFSELSKSDGSYGTNATYDVAFWKVTNSDGTVVLQDDSGKQILYVGTNDFELISSKNGVLAVGSEISGWESSWDEHSYASFEGTFDIYSMEGLKIVSDVAKFDMLDNSDIALVQTTTESYFLFDSKNLTILRNLNYDYVEVVTNYNEYVRVKNYGRYSWENKVGLFDSAGNFIIPAKYQSIDILSNYIQATDKNWNDIYFDFKGNVLNNHGGNSQMVGKYHYVITDTSDGTKSLYHYEKGLVCKLPDDVWNVTSVYSDGFMIASNKDYEYGIINFEGEWTTQPQYQTLGRMADEQTGSGGISIYNPDYTETMNYQYYIAKNDSGYGIIDANNKIMREFVATGISYYSGAYSQNGLLQLHCVMKEHLHNLIRILHM